MTTDDALVKLTESTMEAVCGVLEMFAPGQIAPGDVAVVAEDRHPLEGVPVPAVSSGSMPIMAAARRRAPSTVITNRLPPVTPST